MRCGTEAVSNGARTGFVSAGDYPGHTATRLRYGVIGVRQSVRLWFPGPAHFFYDASADNIPDVGQQQFPTSMCIVRKDFALTFVWDPGPSADCS